MHGHMCAHVLLRPKDNTEHLSHLFFTFFKSDTILNLEFTNRARFLSSKLPLYLTQQYYWDYGHLTFSPVKTKAYMFYLFF